MDEVSTNVEDALEATGDRGWYGFETDKVFCRPELSDAALTATEWAAAKFHRTFPGWELYRRIIADCRLFDDELDAWMVGGARLLARARKMNGRRYIEKRGAWIDQAARDALQSVINLSTVDFGVVIPVARARAIQFEVHPRTWLKIYRPLLAATMIGLDTFRSELFYQYRQAKMHISETRDTMSVNESGFYPVGVMPDFLQRLGNVYTLPTSRSDS